MSDQNQPFNLPSAKQTGNLIELAFSGWALSIEVWLRHGFGSRYVGIQGLFGFIILVGYMMLWNGHDVSPVFWYLVFFLGALFIRRMQGFYRAANGESNHSLYSGTSGLAGKFPQCSELTIKRWVEPIFVACLGGFACLLSPPLGLYLIIGAAMLRFNVERGERWTRMRVREMNDAVFDQEEIAYRFRDMRGDNF